MESKANKKHLLTVVSQSQSYFFCLLSPQSYVHCTDVAMHWNLPMKGHVGAVIV